MFRESQRAVTRFPTQEVNYLWKYGKIKYPHHWHSFTHVKRKYKKNENCTLPETKKLLCTVHLKESTTLCAQYECLQGVQNNERYVLTSCHNNENVTRGSAGTCNCRGVCSCGRQVHVSSRLAVLSLVKKSGTMYCTEHVNPPVCALVLLDNGVGFSSGLQDTAPFQRPHNVGAFPYTNYNSNITCRQS